MEIQKTMPNRERTRMVTLRNRYPHDINDARLGLLLAEACATEAISFFTFEVMMMGNGPWLWW